MDTPALYYAGDGKGELEDDVKLSDDESLLFHSGQKMAVAKPTTTKAPEAYGPALAALWRYHHSLTISHLSAEQATRAVAEDYHCDYDGSYQMNLFLENPDNSYTATSGDIYRYRGRCLLEVVPHQGGSDGDSDSEVSFNWRGIRDSDSFSVVLGASSDRVSYAMSICVETLPGDEAGSSNESSQPSTVDSSSSPSPGPSPPSTPLALSIITPSDSNITINSSNQATEANIEMSDPPKETPTDANEITNPDGDSRVYWQ
ncbi:MAG: hypothetical protein M1840_004171 [Geoglossum simile]|nr:MAG: hypothetical protein M1840_004171 [Geoglossum simile]